MKVKFNKETCEWVKLEDYSSDGYYMSEFLKKKLDRIKEIQKRDWDCVFCITGMEGCLTGDTIIQTTRAETGRKYTLKQLWIRYQGLHKRWSKDIPTFIRAFNDKEIRLHKIKDVLYSGKKQVFFLRLTDGKSIKATANHKFMTREGWKELSALQVGEEIMCDKPKPSPNGRKKIKLYDISFRVPYHPYSQVSKRIEVHRLIYEARMNNLSFTDYLDILLNEPDVAAKLKYIDSEKYHIHHKDGCHYNNSIENLELIDKSDHLKYHGQSSYEYFSQGIPQWIKVESVTPLGIEDVYDIECEEPYHNFAANEIIVHNSGKSTLGEFCLWYLSNETATINHIAANAQEVFDKLEKLPDESCILVDEGDLAFSAKDTMTKEQKSLINVMKVIRQKRMVMIIVAPDWFDLGKYIAVHRSRFLLRTVTDKNLKRGTFQYWGEQKKKILYEIGKKHFNSYSKPRREWATQFKDFKLPFDDDYKKTKQLSLKSAFDKNKQPDISLPQQQALRRILIRKAIPKLVTKGVTDREIGEIFGITSDSVYLLRKEEGILPSTKARTGQKIINSLGELTSEAQKVALTEL